MASRIVDDGFVDVGEVRCDPVRARVYEQGWQSWSPTGLYPATARVSRPPEPVLQTMTHRPEHPAPATCFQGEGLVAVEPEPGGPVRLWTAVDPNGEVPSLRVRTGRDRLVIAANGQVAESSHATTLEPALAAWAEDVAERAQVGQLRPAPTVWCSWYCYWDAVDGTDVADNLLAMEQLELPVDVVQVDDGWQAGIGDWLSVSSAFGPLDRLTAGIIDSGRRPGLWLAPFLVGTGSRLAEAHPGWLVRGASAGHNWGQHLSVLDVTHPEAAEHLADVFRTLVEHGASYFKLDFLYAGALPGRRHADVSPTDAYREGLRLIREAVGPECFLLGCGAPMMPSVGRLDAMRVSSDVTRPDSTGRLSGARVRRAISIGRARSYLHGRWWVNDPDCLVLRPEMPHRQQWAEHVESSGGLVASSDPLRGLDEWGMSALRRLLHRSSVDPVELVMDLADPTKAGSSDAGGDL
jgi:alpha-galactosidase